MGGRAVEGTGLENRQTGNRLVGSNPTPSVAPPLIVACLRPLTPRAYVRRRPLRSISIPRRRASVPAFPGQGGWPGNTRLGRRPKFKLRDQSAGRQIVFNKRPLRDHDAEPVDGCLIGKRCVLELQAAIAIDVVDLRRSDPCRPIGWPVQRAQQYVVRQICRLAQRWGAFEQAGSADREHADLAQDPPIAWPGRRRRARIDADVDILAVEIGVGVRGCDLHVDRHAIGRSIAGKEGKSERSSL